MSALMDYPLTRQGMRDLDHPIRRNEGTVTVKRTASMTEGPRGHIEDGVNVGNPERTASKIAGAILAGIGMTKGGLKGLLLMALGGALTYRGYSGHCAAYAAAGINTAK